MLSLADGFQFERIAARQPDVIIGTNAGMEAEDYAKLSEIAPIYTGGELAAAMYLTTPLSLPYLLD